MTKDSPELAEDSTKLATERAKTNLLLTVSYDGTYYFGMSGPMVFLTEYGIPVNCTDASLSSVSNELMKTITLIHGYFGNKRKFKLARSEELLKRLKSEDSSKDTSAPTSNEFEEAEEYANRFTMIAASRTDRGVHSMGAACQYLSFDREFNFKSLEEFQDALNKRLPEDIRVTSVTIPPTPRFNVRHNNIGKCYIYKVDMSSDPSLFERNYYWQIMSDKHFLNTLLRKYNKVRTEFSFEKLEEAGKVFHGTHNFEGYRKASKGNERSHLIDPICTINSIEFVNNPNDKIDIVVKGNRFLYKMVRCIVSHLILAGFNVIKPDQIKATLETGSEIPNVPYAPAHGLYLKEVYFNKDVQDRIDESKKRYYERLNSVLSR
ncbi:tRNA-pseudouridine synthase I [Theileria orientalis strain Shintoku]|uniref:tRNA pseudouridine synthase n=1 Tax=Theileria orientalis strain Shintoku TaxID=869250 RepID=J4DQD3_THEOR|nr:tRNA-pseudouridine synthase I [Theileria orientalis strain Shintoku]PVC52412.1 tRNA-pseudouridine synthase I [Theileria orientalis]BAM42254.1 tRNA-pseudouridine synthase I [Theileria orientalis strain Shintoku]|eukprot:XP_009692555.1 tRNA-pseudouridine synthase I [Theileria orientalis strain Shintoku]